jgi:hypothetical protein
VVEVVITPPVTQPVFTELVYNRVLEADISEEIPDCLTLELELTGGEADIYAVVEVEPPAYIDYFPIDEATGIISCLPFDNETPDTIPKQVLVTVVATNSATGESDQVWIITTSQKFFSSLVLSYSLGCWLL